MTFYCRKNNPIWRFQLYVISLSLQKGDTSCSDWAISSFYCLRHYCLGIIETRRLMMQRPPYVICLTPGAHPACQLKAATMSQHHWISWSSGGRLFYTTSDWRPFVTVLTNGSQGQPMFTHFLVPDLMFLVTISLCGWVSRASPSRGYRDMSMHGGRSGDLPSSGQFYIKSGAPLGLQWPVPGTMFKQLRWNCDVWKMAAERRNQRGGTSARATQRGCWFIKLL